MSAEIVVIAEAVAKEGNESSLAAAMRACVAPTQAEEGCLFYDLACYVSDARKLVYIERWKSVDALESHKLTDHFITMKAETDVLSAGGLKVTLLSQFAP